MTKETELNESIDAQASTENKEHHVLLKLERKILLANLGVVHQCWKP